MIINNFWFPCRGEWQFALTKQNFLDSPMYIFNIVSPFSLRIMQSEVLVLKSLIFSEVTLILRSPFALPSVCLRSAFEMAPSCFCCCYRCNELIIKEVCFLFRKGMLVGDFCIIHNKISQTPLFSHFPLCP